MITLKPYQVEVLESLREFLRLCSDQGRPEIPFANVRQMLGRPSLPYIAVNAPGIDPAMPYVCLKVPTGGGKTLIASHAVGVAMRELLHAERAVALWLVPSTAILEQTVAALKNPRHPYRRAIELACGSLEVMTTEEALHLTPGAVRGSTVVILGTIQTFRVEDTTGRKVYEQNGALAEHFQNVPGDRMAELTPGPDGKPVPSLANVLRLHRPIVIIDEAHNARTDLSFEILGNLRPACVIEFTATPATSGNPSNVLHEVSAAELKAAEMIKLPVRVFSRQGHQREELIADALKIRDDLERVADLEAQATGEYLRPILLFQAPSVAECAPLRERLIREHEIPEDQIKISVGSNEELAAAGDIAAPSSPVRYVITVQKLREGWDCPFAYVLCSLRETRSATAIEQIVGRILRLPKAKSKQRSELNCAYVFSVSETISEVLAELRDALVGNGFTRTEADRSLEIRAVQPSHSDMTLWHQQATATIPASDFDLPAAETVAANLAGRVRIDAAKGEVTVSGVLEESEISALQQCVTTNEARQSIREAAETVRRRRESFVTDTERREPTPFESGIPFCVPKLSVIENGKLLDFEETFLMEREWNLRDKDASLPADYDPRHRETGRAGTIDIVEGHVIADSVTGIPDFVANLHQSMMSFGMEEDWTVEKLAAWLDREIPHPDLSEAETLEFCLRAIRGLIARMGTDDVGLLALDRFRLRDRVRDRIEKHRAAARREAFQACLIETSDLTVSPDRVLDYSRMTYDPSWLYSGNFEFRKHYFGKPGELAERTESRELTEEFQCARHIEESTGIRYWIRNLVRKSSSFWLQTATNKFYPDFLCLLNDGRVLVVEYKGAHLYENAQEKRAVGEFWARKSGGRCKFVMPSDLDFSVIDKAMRDS